MKTISIFISLLFSIQTFACDFSTIKEVEGGFLYSESCHIQVGKLVEEKKQHEVVVQKLNQALDLKDLALRKQIERADMWKDTAIDMESHYLKADRFNSLENAGYFVLGMGLTALAVWGAGNLAHSH